MSYIDDPSPQLTFSL